jgi:hypothetical protein
MGAYYDRMQALAWAYEGYIARRLRGRGHVVTQHVGQGAQLAHGDLRVDGIDYELKLDQIYARTGNLYIEVAEKRDYRRASWTPSGICSGSSATWYGVGNYRDWFLFQLHELAAAEDYRRPRLEIRHFESAGKGWLLTPALRRGLNVVEYHWADVEADGTPERVYDHH